MTREPAKKKSLQHCPTCGSNRIHTVCTDYCITVRGEEGVVHNLERDECPDCGEVLFSPAAMQRIENYRNQVTAAH